MKKILVKTLSILIFGLTLFITVSCNKDETFTINYPNKIYVTQIEEFEAYSSKNEKLNIEILTPELIEIINGKLVGKSAGIAKLEVSSKKGKTETISIRVLEQPNPTSISISVNIDNDTLLGVKYKYEIYTEPYYAKKDYEIAYDETEIELDYENKTIEFKRSGSYDITCYSMQDVLIRSYHHFDVKLNSEVESYELLYLGNSLTKFSKYYDVPLMVYYMLREFNKYTYITVDDIANQWLDTHNESFMRLIDDREYTHVVLQERSFGMLTDYNRFSTTVDKYLVYIKQNGATPVLYETWGYVNGYNGQAVTGEYISVDKETMRDIIFEKYHEKAEEIGAEIFCSGEAFRKCEEMYPEIELYSDTNHGSTAGGFLSACVHYATLSGRPASNTTYYPKELDEATAKKIKEVADIIVFGK